MSYHSIITDRDSVCLAALTIIKNKALVTAIRPTNISSNNETIKLQRKQQESRILWKNCYSFDDLDEYIVWISLTK